MNLIGVVRHILYCRVLLILPKDSFGTDKNSARYLGDDIPWATEIRQFFTRLTRIIDLLLNIGIRKQNFTSEIKCVDGLHYLLPYSP